MLIGEVPAESTLNFKVARVPPPLIVVFDVKASATLGRSPCLTAGTLPVERKKVCPPDCKNGPSITWVRFKTSELKVKSAKSQPQRLWTLLAVTLTSIVCPILAVCNCSEAGSILIVALVSVVKEAEGVGEGFGFTDPVDPKCTYANIATPIMIIIDIAAIIFHFHH